MDLLALAGEAVHDEERVVQELFVVGDLALERGADVPRQCVVVDLEREGGTSEKKGKEKCR